MSLLSGLFGGTTQTSNPATLFGPQAQFLSQFYPQLQAMFQGFDPSQLTPGFTPTELAGQEAALSQAGQFGQQFMQPALGGLQSLFGAADAMGPMTQRAIEAATNPIFQRFESSIAPQIRRSSIASQPGGGSRGALQIAQAGQQALGQAGDIASNIALQSQRAGLGATQAALGFLPSIAQLGFMPSNIQRQIGEQQRQMQQQQQMAPLTFMDLFRNLSGSPIVLGGGGSSQSTPGLFGGSGLSLFPGGTSLFG